MSGRLGYFSPDTAYLTEIILPFTILSDNLGYANCI